MKKVTRYRLLGFVRLLVADLKHGNPKFKKIEKKIENIDNPNYNKYIGSLL